jgi:hypothetical protein
MMREQAFIAVLPMAADSKVHRMPQIVVAMLSQSESWESVGRKVLENGHTRNIESQNN